MKLGFWTSKSPVLSILLSLLIEHAAGPDAARRVFSLSQPCWSRAYHASGSLLTLLILCVCIVKCFM